MKQNLSIDKARTFKGLSGIYKITNLKTGEFYIGSSKNLQRRYKEWRKEFKNKKRLYLNWLWENKLEDFEFQIIELLPPIDNLLYNKEQFYCDNLKPTLNKEIINVKGGTIWLNKPKLTRKPILQFDLEDNLIKEWDYLTEVSKIGFDQASIRRCCKGKRKTAYGFKWKYK